MVTLTVNIPNEKDLPVLREILDRFGLPYSIDNEVEPFFSETEVKGFIKTKQDFLDGSTTARDWTEIEEELNLARN